MFLLPLARANADIPMPNQELCTVELQEQDGSQCEGCSWHGPTPGAHEEACASPIAKGLSRRCGYGATGAVAIYCDREANWIEVGRGSTGGCSCRTGPEGASSLWILGWVLVVRFRRGNLRR